MCLFLPPNKATTLAPPKDSARAPYLGQQHAHFAGARQRPPRRLARMSDTRLVPAASGLEEEDNSIRIHVGPSSFGSSRPLVTIAFAQCTSSGRPRTCVGCSRVFDSSMACFMMYSTKKANPVPRRFHLWCVARPSELDEVEAESVSGFQTLDPEAAEAVREWMQAPREQWNLPEAERPGHVQVAGPTEDITSAQASGTHAALAAPADAASTGAAAVAPTAAIESANPTATSAAVATSAMAPPPPRIKKRKKDYHIDPVGSRVKPWKGGPFGAEALCSEYEGRPKDTRSTRIGHARSLVTRLQHAIHCGRWADGLRVLAVLLRDFHHLRAALAQAGHALLGATAQHEQLIRFSRRMAALDKANTTTWQLHSASAVLHHAGRWPSRLQAADGLATHAAVQRHTAERLAATTAFLDSALGGCPAHHPCTHAGDLHGQLGAPARSHPRACTSLHELARACTSLHELARACTSLHEVARGCTRLHGGCGPHRHLPRVSPVQGCCCTLN